MSSNTVYMITGVNRGIGYGLMKTLLTRPNTTVIGTIRGDPTSFTTSDLTIASTSTIIIETLSSTSDTDADTVLNTLQTTHGIQCIDILIANAGAADTFNTALSTPLSQLRVDFEINTLGPIKLFQAAWPLLEKAANPKFVYVSSSLGSIEEMEKVPCLAYGVSKAAANFFVRKVHFECEGLVALAVHPGWVKTGNGQMFANSVGVAEPPMSVEDSVNGVLAQIETATKTTTSGYFVSYNGIVIPW